MKPSQRVFKRAVRLLGLDLPDLARLMRLSNGRVVRRYLNGEREPDGPTLLCVDLLVELVPLLREWDGMTDAEVFSDSGLSEMGADAVAGLRKLLREGGLNTQ